MFPVDWRPTADTRALRARAGLLDFIRHFMALRGILEVETPILSHAGNSDPAISQLRTGEPLMLWLRSSPEYAMKRLLAAGSGDIFELGRVFRRGESGRDHNPEFTMLEWYRVGWRYDDLADETADLAMACGAMHGQQWTRSKVTYGELFQRHVGLDPHQATVGAMKKAAERHGIRVNQPDALLRDGWLDLLISHLVQPALPPDAVTLVLDYPASQAALARIRPGEPPVAERFEVFIGSRELANGYQELTDAVEQRQRFEHENRHRAATDSTPVPLDERLLAALDAGLPECAGVALGVDRLLMACLDSVTIGEVLGFPLDHA